METLSIRSWKRLFKPFEVFISYRRGDSPGYAGRLYDSLTSHFGRGRVFMDVTTIEPGVNFVEFIQDEVSSCDVLIALIGQKWLTITDDDGRRRLDDPDDFVQLEIAAALNQGIRVIPMLVQGATMPGVRDLPDPLAELAQLQAHELTDRRWEYDVGLLIKTLKEQSQLSLVSRAKRILGILSLIVLFGVVILGAIRYYPALAAMLSATPTPVAVSSGPVVTPSNTSIRTLTNTPTSRATNTSVSTETPTFTATAAPTGTPTPTGTSTPAPEPSLSLGLTPTDTARPTATHTPKPSATSTSSPTDTPTARPLTAIATTPISMAATTAVSQPGSLLSAPTLLRPDEAHKFEGADAQVILEWSGLKDSLAENELYLITIHYEPKPSISNQEGEVVWTDYASTNGTNWSASDRQYLLDNSVDGLFSWSVKLILSQTVDSDGVPQGPALSEASEERTFVWIRATPGDGDGGGKKEPPPP